MDNSLRLKVHLVLESGSGEQIAEIKRELEVPQILSEKYGPTQEDTLKRLLDMHVTGPARCLAMAHVRSKLPFNPTDASRTALRVVDTLSAAERASFERLAMEVTRQS